MRALSLEYHDVVDGDADSSGFAGHGPASYKLTRQAFEAHLDAIGRLAVRAPERVIDWMAHPSPGGRPLFLTFDDGGASAATVIADMLEQRGWRGHFFMTGSKIGGGTFLSPAQMRELHTRGHVIGSHSHSHPARMGACSDAQLREEWSRSVSAIADILGVPVLTASVPGGFYTKAVASTADAAGIRCLFTSAPTTRAHEVGRCMVLGRYTLREWSPAGTAGAMAAGAWRPRFTQWAVYSTLTLLRHVGGDHYTRLRQLYWNRRR